MSMRELPLPALEVGLRICYAWIVGVYGSVVYVCVADFMKARTSLITGGGPLLSCKVRSCVCV